MKQKWMHSLTALLLAMALLLTLPLLTAQTARAVDLSQKCSLTINPGTFEDLKNANLQYDLYKIADAVADPNYDTYSYSVEKGIDLGDIDISSYEGLAKLTSNEDWQELAQHAAKSILKDGAKVAMYSDYDAESSEASKMLPCGLYLVVAHGSGMKDYVGTNAEDKLVTIANSPRYTYSFLPELVSLPSTAADVSQEVTGGNLTTASGEWVYNVSANLKPEQKERMGDLEIVKELTTYEDSSPVTFVFDIVATMDGETEPVFSDVVGLTFTKAGARTAKIVGKIPVGANVTVTEVYNGSSYEVVGGDTKTTVIVAKDQDPARVTFENKFDNERKKGYGIVNHFSYVEDKGWDNDNEHDSAAE